MTTIAWSKRRAVRATLWFVLFFLTGSIPFAAQHGAEDGDWRYWGGDSGSTRYSALDQINKENVGNLEDRLALVLRQLRPRPRVLLSSHSTRSGRRGLYGRR